MAQKSSALKQLFYIVLLIAPFIISYVAVYYMGIDYTKDLNKYMLYYFGLVGLMETIPLAMLTYSIGDMNPLDANGPSYSDLEAVLFFAGLVLLIGKLISKIFLPKDFYKSAKGNFVQSLVAGFILAFTTVGAIFGMIVLVRMFMKK